MRARSIAWHAFMSERLTGFAASGAQVRDKAIRLAWELMIGVILWSCLGAPVAAHPRHHHSDGPIAAAHARHQAIEAPAIRTATVTSVRREWVSAAGQEAACPCCGGCHGHASSCGCMAGAVCGSSSCSGCNSYALTAFSIINGSSEANRSAMRHFRLHLSGQAGEPLDRPPRA